MGNFYRDNEDMKWYVEKGLDWDSLVRATEFDFRAKDCFTSVDEAVEFYKEIAEQVGEFIANEMSPHQQRFDREGVIFENGEARLPDTLQGIFDQLGEMGLHGLPVPREFGGMNAPLALWYFTGEMIGRADVSSMTHYSFHGGMAMAALIFSIREGTTKVDESGGRIESCRFEKMISEIAAGKAWGAMDITEPDAGSDMARLRCVGEQDADGNWFITGQKIFITSGHAKYHFVIARTEKTADPDDAFAGLKGLSMFLCEAWEDLPDGTRKRNIKIGRVEEKLGHHASVTAELEFDKTPAILIGKRGEGFGYMLTLMNAARVGVGFECIGLCENALRQAEAYAAERKSMGKTIDRHEMIADYLEEMRTDIQCMRALTVSANFHEEMSQKLNLAVQFRTDLSDEERKRREKQRARHAKMARRYTPLLKYLGGEKAVEIAQRAIQIHGGVGYTTEYGVEKLFRDAMVLPIYEGTSQIQSLMAMKDTLGAIMKAPQDFFRRGAQARWRSLSARDSFERRVAKIQYTAFLAQQALIVRTAGDKFKTLADQPVSTWKDQITKNWDPKRDFAYAMLHAERLTRILVDEACAEIFLEQSRKDPARRELLERHLERAEPRVKFLLEEITTTGDRLLNKLGSTTNPAEKAWTQAEQQAAAE